MPFRRVTAAGSSVVDSAATSRWPRLSTPSMSRKRMRMARAHDATVPEPVAAAAAPVAPTYDRHGHHVAHDSSQAASQRTELAAMLLVTNREHHGDSNDLFAA